MKVRTFHTALLTAAMVMGSLSCLLAAETGKVTLLAGDVTMVPPGGANEVVLAKGDSVAEGATIRTAKNGKAVIVMTDSSAIRIAGDSEVVIQTMNQGGGLTQSRVLVNLQEGSVGALIDRSKSNGKIDFKIQTPHGVATARGTFFGVVVHDGKTYTQVEHGTVNVKSVLKN